MTCTCHKQVAVNIQTTSAGKLYRGESLSCYFTVEKVIIHSLHNATHFFCAYNAIANTLLHHFHKAYNPSAVLRLGDIILK